MGSSALIGNQAMFTFTAAGCEEELRVVRFSGQEAVSEPFEIRLEIASAMIALDALVGKDALLTIEGVDGPRYIHGLVCEAGYLGETSSYTLYELTLVPSIWRLTQRSGSRIFQHQTTPQILARVLEAAGIARSSFRLDLQGSYEPHDFCVQYREKDLDFLSRMMEAAGIHYYFEHHDNRHVLVMTDRSEGGPEIAGESPVLRFHDEEARERIHSFRLREAVRTQRVTLRDHNLHQPDQQTEASDGSGPLEFYDYPGGFQQTGKGAPHKGGQLARLHLEALQATRRLATGDSDSPRLVPGYRFTYEDPSRGHLEGDYRVLRVTHRGEQPQVLDEGATGAFRYSNQIVASDAKIPFRPPRRTPRPVVRGVQTATVVGPAGEEIHVDEHGRVKVQFHWDREATGDDGSSCWVRVSQAWAGQGFGAVFLPRVGHEVIVDFIEGDPDRPIITGRVYTGVNTPPYPLPDERTKSTIKSESSPGGGGSNELRFEDAKGSEEVYLHAQKDWTIVVENDKSQQVGNNESLSVGNDRSLTIDHDQQESIGNDRTISVSNNHSESIGAAMTVSVGTDMTVSIGANLTETVGANATRSVGANLSESIAAAKTEDVGLASILTIGAAYQVSVGGAMNESIGLAKLEEVGMIKSVNVGADSSENVGGGKSVSAARNITESAGVNLALSAGKHASVSAGQNFNVSAGKNASIVAADKISMQCGGVTVVIKKNGDVSIKATKLNIKASGAVTIKGSKIKLN